MATIIVGMYSGHDAGVCVLINGTPSIVLEKERLSRVKHDAGQFVGGIITALSLCGLTVDDVDAFATSRGTIRFEDDVSKLNGSFDGCDREQLYTEKEDYKVRKINVLNRVRPCYCIQHHVCHAAASYFSSGFDNAAILSIDGGGDFTHCLMAEGHDSSIKVLAKPPVKLGASYRRVAHRLGFPKIPSSSGRVMGLAAYGEPEYYSDLLSAGGGIEAFNLTSATADMLIGNRPARDCMSKESRNFAASIQRVAEQVVLYLVQQLRRMSDADSLCLSGGVALNCEANYHILRSGLFGRMYVPPCANDAGIALGSALYAASVLGSAARTREMVTPYLGREFSAEEVLMRLSCTPGIVFWRSKDTIRDAAIRLADGEVVGWFQGRSEIGPRALGNRSILANPQLRDIPRSVNSKIKMREAFRPYAPAVAAEESKKYFEDVGIAKYMNVNTRVLDHGRRLFPATTHVDGSARIQIVSQNDNKRFHSLLMEFGKLSGAAVLLNTSFNLSGMPLVDDPLDAIRCLLASRMDCLVIGDYFVKRAGSTVFPWK